MDYVVALYLAHVFDQRLYIAMCSFASFLCKHIVILNLAFFKLQLTVTYNVLKHTYALNFLGNVHYID